MEHLSEFLNVDHRLEARLLLLALFHAVGVDPEVICICKLGAEKDWNTQQDEGQQGLALIDASVAAEEEEFVDDGLDVSERKENQVRSHEDHQQDDRYWKVHDLEAKVVDSH